MFAKIALVTALGTLLCVTQTIAQSTEWSLDPLKSAFPCDAVTFTPTGFVALKPLKITCKGNAALDLAEGKGLDSVIFACDGPTGVYMAGDSSVPNHLLQIMKKDCQH